MKNKLSLRNRLRILFTGRINSIFEKQDFYDASYNSNVWFDYNENWFMVSDMQGKLVGCAKDIIVNDIWSNNEGKELSNRLVDVTVVLQSVFVDGKPNHITP